MQFKVGQIVMLCGERNPRQPVRITKQIARSVFVCALDGHLLCSEIDRGSFGEIIVEQRHLKELDPDIAALYGIDQKED